MSDPFSTAGSAVGVFSLAIVACQGLVSYIGDLKDAKEKTVQIADQMDAFSEHLERLENAVSKLDPSICGDGVQTGVVACMTAIQKMKQKLQSNYKPTSNPNGPKFRQRLKEAKHQFLFPFRKEDILYWKSMAESVQQNLHTALAALILCSTPLHRFGFCLHLQGRAAIEPRKN